MLPVLFAGPCWAHDIPNERIDRAIQVVLAPGRLHIDYEVSLAELTLVRDLRRLSEHAPSPDREVLYRQYGDLVGPLNAKGFMVTLDGRELYLECTGFELAIEQHPRYRFQLRAALPNAGRLRILDANYTSSEGTSRLALRAEPPVTATGYEGPESVAQVPIRPVWMLSDEEERATRQVAVDFKCPSEALTVTGVAPAVPARTAESSRTAWRLADLLRGGGLMRTLFAGLLALVLGAAHALQPGHGKTLVAAAALGTGLNVRGSVVLALATTFAHFASVCGVAALLWLLPATRYAAIQSTLVTSTGVLLAIMGFWRLGRSLSPDDDRGPIIVDSMTPRRQSLILLGLAGGMVPCWDAILLIVVAQLAGVLAFGVFLLGGFSLGMAVVLVTVGLAAGRVRHWFAKRDRTRRWEVMLGASSGLVLAGLGCFLALTPVS